MKYFAPIGGMTFLLLIGLMFWWLYWQEDAAVYKNNVKGQLAVLERFWNQQSTVQDGKLKIGYSDIAPSGFPFGMRVRLLKPYLRDSRGDSIFTLNASYVDLVPLDEEGHHFRIDYPSDGYATIQQGEKIQRFYLTLSTKPPLYAQKVAVGAQFPSAVNQYGVRFPTHLVLTADSDAKHLKFPFKLRSSEEVVYWPLMRDMREKLGALRGMLRRGLLRGL